MRTSASSTSHLLQREFVPAEAGSALTSLLALAASTESAKERERERAVSFGPKDASGPARALSISAVQQRRGTAQGPFTRVPREASVKQGPG